jgi:hypothetical protein
MCTHSSHTQQDNYHTTPTQQSIVDGYVIASLVATGLLLFQFLSTNIRLMYHTFLGADRRMLQAGDDEFGVADVGDNLEEETTTDAATTNGNSNGNSGKAALSQMFSGYGIDSLNRELQRREEERAYILTSGIDTYVPSIDASLGPLWCADTTNLAKVQSTLLYGGYQQASPIGSPVGLPVAPPTGSPRTFFESDACGSLGMERDLTKSSILHRLLDGVGGSGGGSSGGRPDSLRGSDVELFGGPMGSPLASPLDQQNGQLADSLDPTYDESEGLNAIPSDAPLTHRTSRDRIKGLFGSVTTYDPEQAAQAVAGVGCRRNGTGLREWFQEGRVSQGGGTIYEELCQRYGKQSPMPSSNRV